MMENPDKEIGASTWIAIQSGTSTLDSAGKLQMRGEAIVISEPVTTSVLVLFSGQIWGKSSAFYSGPCDKKRNKG